MKPAILVVTILALSYSAVHFAKSGVAVPLQKLNLGKFNEETPALRIHIQTGEPIHSNNPVQYGPAFLLVMDPLLRYVDGGWTLVYVLYALQLTSIGLAFWLTCATIRPFLDRTEDWPLLVAWSAVLWSNFAPLYTTLALKSVETWELLLLSLALFAYLRNRLWVVAFALAAAGLIKVLPLIFFGYLLVTNRPAFVRACAALVVLLLVTHAFYGSEMGLGYLPHVAQSAAGNSYGLLWHENLSLKAALAKLFGQLERPDGALQVSGYYVYLTPAQLKATIVLGDISMVIGLGLLAWACFTREKRSTERVVWEWSLVTVGMLILSPNTLFEYATVALGAITCTAASAFKWRAATPYATWLLLGAAMLLLGVLLPREILNRIVLIETINGWTGIHHFMASEAYQFYCFPLAGLLLMTAAIWRLRPVSIQPISSPASTGGPMPMTSLDSARD